MASCTGPEPADRQTDRQSTAAIQCLKRPWTLAARLLKSHLPYRPRHPGMLGRRDARILKLKGDLCRWAQ